MVTKNSINYNSSDFDALATFDLKDTVVKTISSDAGSATPSSHIYTIVGANGIASSGAGSTITLSGAGLPAGDFDFISSATANNSATITFTGLSSTYFIYMILIEKIVPATDDSELYLRTSTNGGANYDAGASDYAWGYIFAGAASHGTAANTSGSYIRASNALGNAAGETASIRMVLYNPSNTQYTFTMIDESRNNSSSQLISSKRYGCRKSAADVDAIQFLMSAGNITSGNFKLYGLKAS